MAGLNFNITANNSDFISKMNQVNDSIQEAASVADDSGSEIEEIFSKLAKSAAAFGVALEAKEMIGKMIQVRGEMQQTEIALNTMIGSEKEATKLLNQLIKTAAITPFGMTDITESAKQLLAYGVAADEVNDTLVRLGDISAGLGVSIKDLAYLYGTTMVQGRMYTQDLNQFLGRGIPLTAELAKQFGVAESEVKGLVEEGKVGFEQVKTAIVSLTDEGSKFGGLMEAQSASITGQISNIEDGIDQLFNNLGKQSEGVINVVLGGVGKVVDNFDSIAEAIKTLIVAYGSYRAAIAVTVAMQKLQMMVLRQAVVEKRLAAAAGITLSKAEAVAAAQSKLFAAAQMNVVRAVKAATAAMMSNPYTLIAVAIAALVVAMYKLITAESAEDRAARNTAQALDVLNKSIEDHKQQIGGLIDAATDETKTTAERYRAFNALKSVMPELIEKYDTLQKLTSAMADEKTKNGILFSTEQETLDDTNKRLEETIALIKEYQDALVSQDKSLLVSTKDRLKAHADEIKQLYKDMNLGDDGDMTRWELPFTTEAKLALSDFESALESCKQKQEELNKATAEAKKADADEAYKAQFHSLEDVERELANVDKQMADLRNNAGDVEMGLKTNPEPQTLWDKVKSAWDNTVGELVVNFRLNGLEHQKNLLQSLIDNNLGKNYDAAVKRYQAAVKQLDKINKNRGSYTTEQYKEAQREVDEAKKAAQDVGYTPKQKSSTSKGSTETAEERKAHIEKASRQLEELRAKNAEEDKRQIEDLQNEISQLEIDSLADGWEKDQRQRSLNHSLRLQELRREKEDAVAAVKDRAKAEFDAEENIKKQQNKKYTVKQFDWGTDATDKQKEQLSAVEQNYDRQINTQTAINLKEDADALKESLKDYRGYFEQRDDIIKKYQKQAQQWFETDENGNVKTTDGKELAADRSNAVLKEGVTQTNVDELNRQQDEELNAIDRQFASRSEYFQAWCDEVTNVSLERLGELIEQAETELAALEQSGSVDPTQMAMIRAQLNLMKQQKQSKQAKQDTDKNAPKKKTIAKWEQYAAAIGQASEVLEQMADMMPGKLNKIFRTISTLGTAISSIITGITTLAKGSVDSMKTTSEAAEDTIKAVERASVILAIIGAVLEAVQKITSLFGADYSDYNKMKEEYEAVSEVWDELIDKKKEYLSISYGNELKDTREQYEDLVAKKDAAARQMYVERVNSGASAGSHSIGQRFVNKLDDSPETKAAFVAALNKAGSSWSEALGGGRMDGLANLTADQLQIIKEQAPAAWAALDEDMQNYLEDIIECKDQLQEMEETLQTQIAGLTFDEFRNNFLEALQDMDTSAADFAEDMNEYMTNSLISDMFSKKYEENLKKLYDEYYEAMQIADETEREKEAKKVLEKIQDETSKAKADAKAIQDSTGYTNQQQEGSEGGFESMSQDTAEELSGRFTALQVTAQQTYLLVSAMEQYLSASNAVLTVQNSFLSSINDNVAKSNGFLDDILEVNKKIYTEFGERITAMDEKLRTL